jgi:2-polyprenyl-3-methyl-5-hydroxy-6-metoxy-1,4-benzoquinol methylase
MNGLLLSGVMFANHTRAWHDFSVRFLARCKAGADLLEIGPGHGFLLYLASQSASVTSLTAWDVSQASLDATRHAIATLGVVRPVAFQMQDIFSSDLTQPGSTGRFDAIVLSEVLEHLEQPQKALQSLFALCRPGGLVWINVPANSPAPDHLFLLRSPDQAETMLREAGFEIVESMSFPTGDVPLEKAVRQALTISCVITARKPG